MTRENLVAHILSTWRRHNDILLYLLEETPEDGFTAKPSGSRGRDVARQFAHLYRVRLQWLNHHETGKSGDLPRFHKGPPPPREKLHDLLESSGNQVHRWLERSLNGETVPRMFGKNPIRWMGYLIAHESHHRGQIMLALKQSDMRLPDEVSVQGLWGKWIFGQD